MTWGEGMMLPGKRDRDGNRINTQYSEYRYTTEKEYRDHVNEIKRKLEAAEERRLMKDLTSEVWD